MFTVLCLNFFNGQRLLLTGTLGEKKFAKLIDCHNKREKDQKN